MKVLLLKDVAKVGQRNTVHEVSNGYAQNFLLARGLAVPATAQRIAAAQKSQVARAEMKAHEIDEVKAAVAKLNGEAVSISAKANEKGHLFEAVHAENIVAALAEATGVSVDAHMIVIDTPIKEVGEHTVHITVNGEKVDLAIAVV